MISVHHQYVAFSILTSIAILTRTSSLAPVTAGDVPGNTCRSFCGNITVDYPFGTSSGCGHAGFRDLLFCINGVLMFHIPSGSYRVLDIDYAYRALTLQDPGMSTCHSLIRTSTQGSNIKGGNGFVIEPWRAPYLEPAPDNVFMLLGCRAESPLFQGFPGKNLPCRNVSGMGCQEYYECPAWQFTPRRADSSPYGSVSPPECCSLPFGAIRAINLSRLGCDGYSSAYSLAPLQAGGARGWSYGIRVSYSVPADHAAFCRACEATGGTCGYDGLAGGGDLCLCGAWNSTSNCDSPGDSADSSLAISLKCKSSLGSRIFGVEFLICMAMWIGIL